MKEAGKPASSDHDVLLNEERERKKKGPRARQASKQALTQVFILLYFHSLSFSLPRKHWPQLFLFPPRSLLLS